MGWDVGWSLAQKVEQPPEPFLGERKNVEGGRGHLWFRLRTCVGQQCARRRRDWLLVAEFYGLTAKG